MARLEEELNCSGLHGFATGYVLGKANTPMPYKTEGKDSYCASTCQVAKSCWSKHRVKVRIMFPRATAIFDRMVFKLGQDNAMGIWKAWAKDLNKKYPFMADKMPEQDPYLLQMTANLQDGYAYAKTGKVIDRGAYTLNYPRTNA